MRLTPFCAHKFTAGSDWASGDFDGNGTTDVRDFNIWNAHKFTAAVVAAPLAEGRIPEPGVLVLLTCGALALLPVWRRTRR